jgi:hypothetical protein
VHNLFYVNMDMCGLGFHPLSALGGGGGVGSVCRRYGQTVPFCFFSALWSVLVVGWEDLFHWSLMEGGDATGAWCF